jgi:putative Mn2+ efflux pump MntP
MNFLSKVVGYSGKLFFATIMFFAMIISTVVSLPFIGAGMIKDAINAHHHHQAEENDLIDEYSEY